MKFNVGDIVWIKWEDHYHDYTQGWRDRANADTDPLYCETVGFVVFDTKDRIGLSATTQVHDQRFSGGLAVKLKRCIIASKVLKRA